jgi:pimeloyl-ACP methyl ester carboxylesterase
MPSAGTLSIQTEDGVTLAGEQAGAGPAIVLLHGLTATRRYVVMGSRLLERSGHRVIAYDARGHGDSTPARDPTAYGYERLTADLETVLDALEVPQATLAGASMGAHTALRFALDHPDRIAALAIITPAYDPSAPPASKADSSYRTALAQALRESGSGGFVSAYDFSTLRPEWRETVRRALRQRLAAHEHPEAVADAMDVLAREEPFDRLSELGAIRAPTLVVASRDEADPGHPLALAERYAESIPDAELAVEEAGPPARSPIAWQGGQLSRLLAALAARAGRTSPDT